MKKHALLPMLFLAGTCVFGAVSCSNNETNETSVFAATKTSAEEKNKLEIGLGAATLYPGESTELTIDYNGDSFLKVYATEEDADDYLAISKKEGSDYVYVISAKEGIEGNHGLHINVKEDKDGGLKRTVKLNVNEKIVMSLSDESASISVGNQHVLTLNYNGKEEIKYDVENASIVSVERKNFSYQHYAIYEITGLAAGETRIKFEAGDLNAYFSVSVTKNYDVDKYKDAIDYVISDEYDDTTEKINISFTGVGEKVYRLKVQYANHTYRIQTDLSNWTNSGSSGNINITVIKPNGMGATFTKIDGKRLYFRSDEAGDYYLVIKNNSTSWKTLSGIYVIPTHEDNLEYQFCTNCGHFYVSGHELEIRKPSDSRTNLSNPITIEAARNSIYYDENFMAKISKPGRYALDIVLVGNLNNVDISVVDKDLNDIADQGTSGSYAIHYEFKAEGNYYFKITNKNTSDVTIKLLALIDLN